MSIKQKETEIKFSKEKIVQNRPQESPKDYFILILIILVAFGSFGLGRLSMTELKKKQPIIFEQSLSASILNTSSQKKETTNISSGTLVASKNGTKYHFPWCSGAQRINEENKIWFNSSEEAKKAGYTPAANCKGLQ